MNIHTDPLVSFSVQYDIKLYLLITEEGEASQNPAVVRCIPEKENSSECILSAFPFQVTQ